VATFTNNFYGGGKGYNLCLDVTTNSQNAANNTSNVTVTVRLVSLGSSYTIKSSTSKNGSVTIDGTKYTFTFTAGLTGSQNKTLFTKTLDVTHGSDGKKTLSVSATCYLGVTLSGTFYGNTTVSGSTALTAIPRTTPVSISGSGTFGSSKWIGHSRASTSFTVTLRYSCGTVNGTIVSKSATNETYWTPPKSLQNQIPKATNITITVYCDTYSGNTLIGTTSTSFVCYIASDCVPTINGCEFMNGENYGTSYYQGVNTVRLVADVSGAYGSTISKYEYTIDGKTKTNYGYIMYTDIVYTSGYKDITMTITDSRGKTATKTWTSAVYFTAYTKPQITNFTCKRMGYDDNKNLVISNLGTVGYFTASGTFHSNSSSQSRKFMYKPTTSSSWTTINLSNKNYTDYQFSTSLATGSAYDLKFVMTDNVTSVEMQIKMQNLYPLINMNAAGNAIAFGKECNADNKFMVMLPASFNDTISMWDAHITGYFNSDAALNVTTNGTVGTYYGNQIWLNDALSLSSGGSGGSLYLNSAAQHTDIEIIGRSLFRTRGNRAQLVTIQTSGDGNGSGDGDTHLGYYQSNLGGYGHWFRGLGQFVIDNLYGLVVTKGNICLSGSGWLMADKMSYTSSGGWVNSSGIQTWGVGCSNHFLPTETTRYLGTSSNRWQQLYCVSSPSVSSDARNKENVKYMYDEPEVMCEFTDVKENDEITTHDLLDFVLNDLHMVTFDYKQELSEDMDEDEKQMVTAMNNRQIGFIAQDIENTKVGKYLVTKDKEGVLSYESSNWPSIIAGALQQEIRDRQAADKELMDMLNDIINE
jgi:hypothetical protein